MPEAYDAFISYSHAADGALAPAVQRGLSRLAKPWYRREALRVFRDDTGLAVTPELWGAIATALDGSEHFVLLASPEAAASEWVNREVEHWKTHKSTSTLLPVLTAGEWIWDARANDLDRTASTAVPAALFGAFTEEPRHLDLRWARNEDHLDLRNGRFRNAVAELAAPLRGVPKEELESEDLRQHRRAMRLARAAVTSLVVLTVAALIAGGLAVVNANRAEDRRVQATARQLSAQALSIEGDSPVEALMLASAAHQLDRGQESTDALLALAQSRPRLERFLDTTPGAEIPTIAVNDDHRQVAFVRTEGTATTAVVASIDGAATGTTIHRRVDGLEGLSFVDDTHVALFGRRVAVMDLDGEVRDVTARRPGSSWVLSTDGRTAAVVGRDGATVVVDLEARTRVASVQPPTPQAAGFVAFDPDGSHVLVPGRSAWQLVETRAREAPIDVAFPSTVGPVTPRILPNGAVFGAGERELVVLPAPGAGAGGTVVIPLDAADGAYWFDVSRDGALVVVRTQQRRFVAELGTGRVLWEQTAAPLTSYSGVVRLGFSESGQRAYELASDGFLLFASGAGDAVRSNGAATEVSVDSHGRRALTTAGKTLSLLDLESGSTTIEHQAYVSNVVWSDDGKYLLTDTDLWQLERGDGTPPESLRTAGQTQSAAFAGRHLVTSGSESVALWRLGSVAPAGRIVDAGRDLVFEALDPDGRGSIRVADTDAGYEVRDASGRVLATVRRAGVSVDGVTLLFGGARALVDHGEGLDLVDLTTGRLVRRGTVCGTFESGRLTPSADGSHVLATLDDDVVRVGDERLRSCRAQDGRAVGTVTPRAGVTGIAGPSKDGSLAAFTSRGEVRVVEMRGGRETERFAMPGPTTWEGGSRGRAAFTPDDRRIVAEWVFGTVVHDRVDRSTRSVRRAHVNEIWIPQRIDVDPTGRFAVITAAAGVDNLLRGLATEISMVDLGSLRVAGPIQVPSIALVTGTRLVASGGAIEVTGAEITDTGDARRLTVRIDVNPDDLAKDVCGLLGHTPTHEEWAERLPSTEYVEVCREGAA